MNPLRQGFSWWCYADKGVDADALLAGAADIGFEAVDLVEESLWPQVKKAGLKLGAVMGHAAAGLNRRENASVIENELRASIAKAKEWEIPVLICFSGNQESLSDTEGIAACAEVLGRLAPEAEQAGVVLAMELLNSKVDHKDYQCAHTDWGLRLCEQVGSPAVKLLYDIYHMQIMEGDLIRTIQRSHASFVHYHTAGNPGRRQPDEGQEINYPAVYRAISATGYTGLVSHEFLVDEKPLDALRKAFQDCRAATR